MLRKSLIAGFAVFSMLFGSGNIVFPLIVGRRFPTDWIIADLGWLVAAVFIPMFGYYGAMLFDADNKKYLSPIGKYLTAALIFFIMMLVGPFGGIARNINVSLGGMHVVMPEISNISFNLFYCVVMVLLSWNPNKIVQVLGVIFTPLKFFGVAIIILGGLYFFHFDENSNSFQHEDTNAFIEGFKTGYQTMDLLAAIIMTSSIYLYIKNALSKEEQGNRKILLKSCGYACATGGIVLSVVYTGLILVSARCSSLLSGVPDEEIFAKIADIAMGSYASWFVAIVTTVCCIATNIALTSIFTDYVHEVLCKGKFNRHVILIIVGILSFVMSLLGFARLCSLLGMALEKVYPLLIIFIFLRVVHYYIAGVRQKR